MIPKTLTYSRTANLGNYNSERLEVTAELQPGDNPIEVAAYLKNWVEVQLGLKQPPSDAEEALF